jgi:hypothetical protein
VIAIQQRDRSACAEHVIVWVRCEQEDCFVLNLLEAGRLSKDGSGAANYSEQPKHGRFHVDSP